MIEYEGKKYARVSEILAQLGGFSDIDPIVLAKKQQIGTSVHEAIKNDIENGLCPDFPQEPNRCFPYFTSYIKWKEKTGPIFRESETRYFCDKKSITGQIDALIEMNDSVYLVDFKTSAIPDPQKWPLQAHLYYYLLIQNGKEVSKKFIFLQLAKNGFYPTAYIYNYDENIMCRCMELIDLYFNDNK
jgi:hypothetical protein